MTAPLHAVAVASPGLGKGLDDVLDTEELMNEADLTAALQQPTPKGRKGRGQKGAGSVTPEKQAASELLGRSDSLSARERNKLKRKAKVLERQSSLRLDSKGRVRAAGSIHLLSFFNPLVGPVCQQACSSLPLGSGHVTAHW
jgi:hypothetical protein